MWPKRDLPTLFATIATRYDRANSLCSLGLHKKWNQAMIAAVGPVDTLVDLCAGTGAIALGYLASHPQARAILVDFCPEMLAVAAAKGASMQHRFTLMTEDVEALSLPSRSADAVTIAYGIRNLAHPLRCFHEVARILKPGGHLYLLELTRPPSPLLASLHRLYLRHLLPLIGYGVTAQPAAYRYLAESIQTFSPPEAVETCLTEAQLTPVKRTPLGGGIATLFIAQGSAL